MCPKQVSAYGDNQGGRAPDFTLMRAGFFVRW